ncbi:MAG: hypothetical protein CMG66_04000 [Candidatus Marinimicrobia bacterium]|nr:hypothetical protein [Candidatus Neomarinimicrobiota bacterium]|tara:strand:+ start:13211 stop:13951 length:741 start_codon:yes stop_codon:yes gene_type:complete
MIIDHDRIQGFMEPMIMHFNIHDNVKMEEFEILDSVRFDLVITEKAHYAINFKIIGKRLDSADNTDLDFLDDDKSLYNVKEVGEKFDNVKFLKTNNSNYELYKSNKDFTIISYIFSRCPMPEMCPAVISKNQFLADTFNKENIEFLIISFDYIFDTPETLLEQYGSIEDNYPNVTFLSSTNHYNDLILLTKQSDVSFGGVEENNIGHTMRTIILNKNKQLLKAYEGYNWTPADLKKDLLNFIKMNK